MIALKISHSAEFVPPQIFFLFAVVSLAENFHRLSRIRFGESARHFVLKGNQAHDPVFGDILRDLPLHSGGLRSRSPGIDEHKRARKTGFFHQIQRILKVLFGLRRKAHHNIRGNRTFRNVFFQQFQLAEIIFSRVFPVHQFQDAIRTGLNGQMHAPADMGRLFHCKNQFLGKILRVIGHKAQAVVPIDRPYFPQKRGKIRSVVQIFAVRIDVLPQKRDLFISLRDEFSAFRDDILRFAAALPPPDVGNDAVSTEIVAAVHNVDPCVRIAVSLFFTAVRLPFAVEHFDYGFFLR